MQFSEGATDKDLRSSQSFFELSKKHVAARITIEQRYFGWNEIYPRNNSGGLQWLTVE